MEKKPLEENTNEENLIKPENEELNDDSLGVFDDIENSTIFAKREDNVNSKKQLSGSKKRMRLLIILVAAILVISAGIAAVIIFSPKDEEQESEYNSAIAVKVVSSENVEKIEINNQSGKLVFLSKENPEYSADNENGAYVSKYIWSLEGYDESLIASSSVNAAADNAAAVYALREMTDKTLDYGLDKPHITVNVFMRDSTPNYTVLIGDKAPDGTGYYAKVSDSDKIYLISTGSVENFDTTPEKLANTVLIDPPTKTTDTKASDRKYFDDDGNIATFDNIKIAGTHYDETIIVTPITSDNAMAEYYVTVGNNTRYADTEAAKGLFGIATNGLVAIDTYKLMPTLEDIKKYKLDNPEFDITLKFGSGIIKLKASYFDAENNYYAVMVDGIDGIYAATADAVSMLAYSTEDYYNDFIFLEYLKDMKNIQVETSAKTYSFDVKYNSEDEEILGYYKGAPIDSSLLSAYYQYFTTLSPEIKESYVSGKAEVTATFTFNDSEKGKMQMQFVRQSDRRFLVILDGQKMGLVTSTVVDHIIEYAQYVVDGKGIPSAS